MSELVFPGIPSRGGHTPDSLPADPSTVSFFSITIN
jgi:hypothetical protein